MPEGQPHRDPGKRPESHQCGRDFSLRCRPRHGRGAVDTRLQQSPVPAQRPGQHGYGVSDPLGIHRGMARRGAAEIALALSEPAAYEVWALATNGARLENLPTSVSEGCLQFRADVLGSDGKARFLYEIVRK